MITPYRYICLDCGVEMQRCDVCGGVIHPANTHGVIPPVHHHPVCPAAPEGVTRYTVEEAIA